MIARPSRICRRLFLAVTAIVFALSAVMPSVATAGTIDDILSSAPVHKKTLKDNGDGTYDLTLSVTGDTEEESKPIDVVLIIDASTSMNKNIDGNRSKTRMQAAHDAVAALANELLTSENAALPENQQIKLSVVKFGDKAQVAQGFSNNAGDIANAVPTKAKYFEGTNWEDGFIKANALSSGREGAEKYIVFLSDDDPTQRISAEGPSVPNLDGTYGTGVGDELGRNYSAAKREANNRGEASLYMVKASKGAKKMSTFAAETNATLLDGTTESALTEAFSQIAQTLKMTASYKDVKLVDQLSQWVEFSTADGGSVANIRYAKGGVAWNDAPAATVTEDKLTWDLTGIGELEEGVEYSVTFTVRPSAAARDDVAARGAEATYETNVADKSLVEYKTAVKQTGKDDVVSNVQTSLFATVPTITLAAPAPVTVDGAAELSGAKTLKGRALEDGEFLFAISVAEGSEAATPLPAETTVANNADGSFHFGDIEFTKTGAYLYDVTEDTTALPAGVSAVTQSQRVKIIVTTKDDGSLTANVEMPADGLTFVNEYKTNDGTDKVAINVTGSKVINAADGLTAPALNDDDFTFTIEPKTADAPLPANTTVANKDGKIDFGDITFTKAMLGDKMRKTFTYVVTEGGSKPGVTNDASKTIKVVVTDDGRGRLGAEIEGDLDFVNTYSASLAKVSLKATKVLKGANLTDGAFTFELLGNDGLMDSATNDADGNVKFRELTLNEPGTYTFKMVEVAGDAKGMTYDNSEYTVNVTVVDNGKGRLVANVEGNNPTFTNTYKAADVKPGKTDKSDKSGNSGKSGKSDKGIPETGDSSMVLPIVLCVVAGVCIAVGVIANRKKN